MSEYSVVTVNRFALSVDEDEDLYELLEKQQDDKKKKEEQAAAEAAKVSTSKGKVDKKGALKQTSANKQKPTKSVEPVPVAQQQSNQKPYPRNDENRPPRFARQAKEGTDSQGFEKPPQSADGGRGGRRGGFSGRGGRGGNRNGFAPRSGKREFERHSGSDRTGVKAVEKKEGGGAHNWGDQIEAQLSPETQAEPVTETEISPENNEPQESVENKEPQQPEKEEEKTMTLDEYKASLNKTTKAEFKLRKPNEGVDTKQWKGTIPLENKKKKGDSDDEVELDEEDDDAEETEEQDNTTKATLEKLGVTVKFSSEDNQRPRGNFRGRGREFRGRDGGPRPRGRGGRSNNSDKRDSSKPFKSSLDNEADFPSLGSR